MAEPNYNLLNTQIPAQAAAAPMQGAQQANAFVSQMLQNKATNMEIQNAMAEQEAYKKAGGDVAAAQQNLMGAGLGKQSVALGKSVAETQQAQMKTLAERLPIQRDMAKDMAFNPSDQNIQAHLQDQVIKGWITSQEAQMRWQRVAGMNPQQREQFFLQGATKAEDVMQQQLRQQERERGTVPAGYRMTSEGTLEAIPGGPTTTPLAPKELQKRNADFPAAKSAVEGYETKADNFVKDLQALRDHPGLDSITGIAAGRLPGVTAEGRAAQALYDKIVAKGGFQALQDLRAASKTGGALGNVSNQEGKQLVQSFAAIDRRQNAEDVRAALDQAISDVEGSKTRVRDAYDTTYEYKLGGGTPAAGGTPVTGNSPAAQALAKFRASKGQ